MLQSPLFQRLIRTKPIVAEQEEAAHSGFKRTLSALDLVVFGVSAMIGTGIFVLTGEAAANAAGPALVISIALTGVLCAFCALCYSELSAMLPVAGSAYSYLYVSLGEGAAWLTGWLLMLEYITAVMAIAISWGESVKHSLGTLLHIHLPDVLTTNTVQILENARQVATTPHLIMAQIPFHLPGVAATQVLVLKQAFNLLPVLAVGVSTWLLCRGIEENAKVANVLVYIKTAVILLFVGAGALYLVQHPQVMHLHWFAKGWDTFAPFGWQGISGGAALMFFAYVGFDAVAATSEEAKNPQRDLPIGILGSLVVCTLLYMLVTVVVTGVLPLQEIAQHKEAAVVHAMGMMHIPVADWVVNIGAIVGISSVLLMMELASIRVIFAVARDGLLPKKLATLHPKLGVPLATTLAVGLLCVLGSGLLPISLMVHLSNLGTLFTFAMVCLSVAVLRVTAPSAGRPFKVPAGLTVALLGTVGCTALMLSLSPNAWVLTGFAVALGIAIYLFYGSQNSVLNVPAAGASSSSPAGD
jgi:APA family basic amino acid/polyamine antiporter